MTSDEIFLEFGGEPAATDLPRLLAQYRHLETLQTTISDTITFHRDRIRVFLEAAGIDSARTDLGSAVIARPSAKAVVVDPFLALKWAKNHAPGAVVEVLSPVFVKSLKVAGDAAVTSDGEPVPGVEVRVGEPYLVVKLAKDEAMTDRNEREHT